MKVLLIEDEQEIRKYLKSVLEAASMKMIEAICAKDAIATIVSQSPNLIILDLGLPDKDGQDLIKELREWCRTPIIVLSARDDDTQKVTALENGADDYLTKPFSANELLARINVAMRHATENSAKSVVNFKFQNLSIDYSSRIVTIDENEINLTPIEYQILLILTKNAGKVLTHTQLLNAIWGKRAASDNTYLRIHMQHLREKLGDNPIEPRFIFTAPGIGYRFKA